MKAWDNWKQKRGRSVFRKRSKQVAFPHQFLDLDDAKRIGYIVDTSAMSDAELMWFAQYLDIISESGKEPYVVELNFKKKVGPVLGMHSKGLFFGSKHRNWLGLPAMQRMKELNAAKLDLLMDLTDSETATFICGLSNAITRVGLFRTGFEAHFELMLELPEKTPIRTRIEQFEHYSKMLKK